MATNIDNESIPATAPESFINRPLPDYHRPEPVGLMGQPSK